MKYLYYEDEFNVDEKSHALREKWMIIRYFQVKYLIYQVIFQ